MKVTQGRPVTTKNQQRPKFKNPEFLATNAHRRVVPTHALISKHWRQVRHWHYWLQRVYPNLRDTLPQQLHSLTQKYTNYALYTACKANVRAGRHRRRFTIHFKVFRNGGLARSPRLCHTASRHLKLKGWEHQLTYLMFAPSRSDPATFLNASLASRTVLNPLYPSRLPATRVRWDICLITLIML